MYAICQARLWPCRQPAEAAPRTRSGSMPGCRLAMRYPGPCNAYHGHRFPIQGAWLEFPSTTASLWLPAARRLRGAASAATRYVASGRYRHPRMRPLPCQLHGLSSQCRHLPGRSIGDALPGHAPESARRRRRSRNASLPRGTLPGTGDAARTRTEWAQLQHRSHRARPCTLIRTGDSSRRRSSRWIGNHRSGFPQRTPTFTCRARGYCRAV